MGELRDRMKMDMELKHLSPRTIETYLGCVKKIAVHYAKSLDGQLPRRGMVLHHSHPENDEHTLFI